jgi:hypothetical protein
MISLNKYGIYEENMGKGFEIGIGFLKFKNLTTLYLDFT